MTPTLWGRIQTRWIMLWTVGLAWLIVVGPILPLAGPVVGVYSAGVAALVLTSVVGTGLEFLYHGLQQLRWDKDWPTILGLVLGLFEGWIVFELLSRNLPWMIEGLAWQAFAWQFGTIWVVVWCVVNGPLRVAFPRWRFAGGEFI